jgi:hypothetical protein
MHRATPQQMSKSLQAVEVMKAEGIQFIPIPVFGDEDRLHYIKILKCKLDLALAEILETENREKK